jgi:hypothetical protein
MPEETNDPPAIAGKQGRTEAVEISEHADPLIGS